MKNTRQMKWACFCVPISEGLRNFATALRITRTNALNRLSKVKYYHANEF